MSTGDYYYELSPEYSPPLKEGMTITERHEWVVNVINHFHSQGLTEDVQEYEKPDGSIEKKRIPIDMLWGYTAMAQKAQAAGLDETRKLSKEERDIMLSTLGQLVMSAPEMDAWSRLLRPVYSISQQTLGTDDWFRCIIGPWFFDPELTINERQTLICHELCHPIFGHTAPNRGVDPVLNNLAGDLQINQGLEKNKNLQWPREGLKHVYPNGRRAWPASAKRVGVFPDDVSTADYPDGLPEANTYEWYYQELLSDRLSRSKNKTVSTISKNDDSADKTRNDATPDNNGSKTASNGDGSTASTDSMLANDRRESESNNDGHEPTSRKVCVSGSMMPSVSGDGSGVVCGGVLGAGDEDRLDSMGIEKAGDYEKINARNESIAAARARLNNYGRGTSGSGFTEWFMERLLPPRVPWMREFRGILSKTAADLKAGRSDYSYRRPRRRLDQNNPDVVHPGLIDYQVKVVFGLDTSGSMGDEDTLKALSEINGCVRKITGSCTLVTVDTEIASIQSIHDLRHGVKITSGGGTIMRRFYDWLDKLPRQSRPDVSILATDGEIDWGDCYEFIRRDRKFSKHIILVTQKSGWSYGSRGFYYTGGSEHDYISKINKLKNGRVIYIGTEDLRK